MMFHVTSLTVVQNRNLLFMDKHHVSSLGNFGTIMECLTVDSADNTLKYTSVQEDINDTASLWYERWINMILNHGFSLLTDVHEQYYSKRYFK